MRLRLGGCWLALSVAIFGCHNKEPKGIVRDPVYKLTGQLMIDGNPEQLVGVVCHRQGDPDPDAGTSAVLTKSAFTDANGKFAIGTYESGDGAPNGDYVFTFQWGAFGTSGRYVGDKFNGKYKNPAKSEVKATIEGAPVDLGVIELTTK